MPANAGEIAPQQVIDQIVKPVLVRTAVVVSESDDLAGGGADAGIAGGGKTLVGLTEIANLGE